MARSRAGDPPVVRFYQLGATPREQALARILAKAWERHLRCCVVASDPAHAGYLDDFLWSHPAAGIFLPHGLENTPQARLQPVLIATAPVEVNGATVAVMACERLLENPERFDMVVEFVESARPDALRTSRERYRRYRELGCTMEYWEQGEGGWSRKA